MFHVRKQIRDGVKSLLTGLPTTGANVFDARPAGRWLKEHEMPGLVIDAGSEQIVRGSMGVRGLNERTLTLRVTVYVKEQGFADTRDQIIAEVEEAIASDQTLGGLCKYIQLTAIDADEEGELERPAGTVDLYFDVLYYTAINAPTEPR